MSKQQTVKQANDTSRNLYFCHKTFLTLEYWQWTTIKKTARCLDTHRDNNIIHNFTDVNILHEISCLPWEVYLHEIHDFPRISMYLCSFV